MLKPQIALDVIPSSPNNAAVTSADRVTRSDKALRWQHTFGTPMPPRLHYALAADCLMYEQQVQAARGLSRDAERALAALLPPKEPASSGKFNTRLLRTWQGRTYTRAAAARWTSKHGSLLAGMMVDAQGQRLTPSHTAKAGRRYRYYLGRKGEPDNANGTSGSARRTCVPAHDLERLITAEWRSLLASVDLDVQLEVDAPEISTQIRNAAQRLSDAWPEMPLPAQRHALLAAGLQVTVGRTQLRLSISRDGLLALLEGTPPLLNRRGLEDINPLIRTIDAEVIRLHGETRILEDETQSQTRAVAPMHLTLLRAIAQGRVWHKQLISGEMTLQTLASQIGMAPIQIQRKLQCAWLAPDLIEGLLEGRASSRLSLASVRAKFTIDWAAQRRLWA